MVWVGLIGYETCSTEGVLYLDIINTVKHLERGTRKTFRRVGNAVLQTWHSYSQQLCLLSQDLYNMKPVKIFEYVRSRAPRVPPFAGEPKAVDSCWEERRSLFFRRESGHW